MTALRITPVDDNKVEEGTWTQYRGVKLRIARANNTKFKRLFTQMMKPYQSRGNPTAINDNISEEDMKEILCTAMSKAILMDWDNFSIKGEDIEFSEENAYSLLFLDDDCRDFVHQFANNLENFLKEEEEEIVGKSLQA